MRGRLAVALGVIWQMSAKGVGGLYTASAPCHKQAQSPSRNHEEHPMKKTTLSALALTALLAASSTARAQDAAAGKTPFKIGRAHV